MGGFLLAQEASNEKRIGLDSGKLLAIQALNRATQHMPVTRLEIHTSAYDAHPRRLYRYRWLKNER